jgi:hypothetical protein
MSFALPVTANESLVGLWWIEHEDGAPLQVRLYAGGAAWSDYPSNNPGEWSYQDGKVVCLWADGWKEVFVEERGYWLKLGYTPETALSSEPSNRSRAFRVSPAPDGWFGIAP